MVEQNFDQDSNNHYQEENELAEQYIEKEDLPAAAKILVAIVDKNPNNARAFNNMGIISWLKKGWHDALMMFKRATLINPTYSDALINLFDAAIKLQKISDVYPIFEKAHQLNPDDQEISTIVDAIKQQGDSIYESERALRMGIYNPRIEKANNLLEEGNINGAMEAYIAILDQEGPHAEIYCGLGIISYYQDRYKDAFSLFYESIKLNPTDPDTYLNLLDASKMCGVVDQAKKVFDHFCNVYPSLKILQDTFEEVTDAIT